MNTNLASKSSSRLVGCAHSVRPPQRPLSRAEMVRSPFNNKSGGHAQSRQNGRIHIINGFRGHSPSHSMLSDRLNMTSPVCVSELSKPSNRVQFRTHVSRNINDRIMASIRPVSAPVRTGTRQRNKRQLPTSARGKCMSGTRSTTLDDDHDMFNVVKAAKEFKDFEEDAEYFRKLERSLQNPEGDEEKRDSAPVFNKRLFASQGTVIMTREARRLMFNNGKANERCDLDTRLTKSEIQCLRCVTEGLKLIHKGHAFVKDVVSSVISYEIYKAFEYVPLKHWEDALSCYYILNGAVEVTYDLKSTESRNVFQANIIYSHGTGEYLGLVSSEGPKEDLAPPATIYTKELTQFIRIDRQRFHKLMENATALVDKQKRDYISSHSFLANVSEEVIEKILAKFTIQEYPANKVLLPQGELTEHLFIVMEGRCQTYREVFIPEADKEVLFYLTSRDPDDFFGEECLLDHAPSFCTVVTATASTCLKLHRSALEMVNRDKLTHFIDISRHEFTSDDELKTRGYKDSIWNKFKHSHIKGTLKEGGKMRYLNKAAASVVYERPPDKREQYTENMRQFVLKGANFEPMRVQSAVLPKNRHGLPTRPQTAFASNTAHYTDIENENEDNGTDEDDKEASVEVNKPESKLLTTDGAKEIEKHIAKRKRTRNSVCRVMFKAMESKEALLKVLDDRGDFGGHHKQAWKADEGQENFMKNGVLVTMTSEDIVRKAKALADTYSDKWKHRMADKEEEEWDTILHAENKQAKMLITANRLRMKDLKRRLAELQKQREKAKLKYAPRKTYEEENKENAELLTMNSNGASENVDTSTEIQEDCLKTENNEIRHKVVDTDKTENSYEVVDDYRNSRTDDFDTDLNIPVANGVLRSQFCES